MYSLFISNNPYLYKDIIPELIHIYENNINKDIKNISYFL